MEPVEGIEPSLPRYKLGSLPLQHTGKNGGEGIAFLTNQFQPVRYDLPC